MLGAFGPPPNAFYPSEPDPSTDDPIDDPNCKLGSIIECENQILGETIELVGTPLALHYQSDRQVGYYRTVRVPLIAPDKSHPDLKAIVVKGSFAGKWFLETFNPTVTEATIVWDGHDGFGGLTQGAQHVFVRIGYVFKGSYESTPGFGAPGTDITASAADTTVTLWRDWHGLIGGYYAAYAALGGWNLDEHHFYDPTAKVVYMGDGTRRHSKNVGNTIDTFAGTGNPNLPCDDSTQPAVGAKMFPVALDLAPDGSLVFADSCNTSTLKRISDGIVETILGPQLALGIHGVAVAPDGTIYYTRGPLHDVRKLDPLGNESLVAGTGVECPPGPGSACGDAGPATQADVGYPWGIALGLDGSIYVSEQDAARVRRIDPGGVITTVAGGSGWCSEYDPSCGDEGPAKDATLSAPRGLAVGTDGVLFIADYYRVRGITPDGVIHPVAGKATGHVPLWCEPGSTAANCRDMIVEDVALGPDGLYIATRQLNKVLRAAPPFVVPFGPTGELDAIAGGHVDDDCESYECTGQAACDPLYVCGDGFPPNSAAISQTYGIVVGADGTPYIADGGGRIEWIKPSFPGISLESFVIVSNDGSRYFVFDKLGRHTETRDALTNRLLMSFSGVPVSSATDAEGQVTTISRSPSQIVISGPFNQETTLGLTPILAYDYATTITNPASESYALGYYGYPQEGLLESFMTPKGHTTSFAYSEYGLLEHEWRADGGYVGLTRERLPLPQRGHTVDVAELAVAPLATLTTTHLYAPTAAGSERSTTAPDGLTVVTSTTPDGSETRTYPDGTVLAITKGPDPRFGQQAPVAKQVTVSTGGKTMVLEQQRAVVLADPNQVTSLLAHTDYLTVNGRTVQTHFDGATAPRTITTTTQAGRQQIAALDADDRVASVYVPSSLGLLPVELTYYAAGPAKGRVQTVRQGTGAEERLYTYTYDALARPHIVTAPEAMATSLDYDLASRVTSLTLPGGAEVGFGYDANGNVSSVSPPGQPSHVLSYTPIDLFDQYLAPGAQALDADYTLDRKAKKLTLPSAETVERFYDDLGRLDQVIAGDDTLDYAYVDLTDPEHPGKLDHISSSQDGVTLAFGYSGSLLASSTWTGTVAGTVSWEYDNDFRVVSETVQGTAPVAYVYGDGDGLLTAAGALSLTRDPDTGLLVGTTLDHIAEVLAYNPFGEIEHREVSYTGGGADAPAPLFTVTYARDGLGRLTSITESVQGGQAKVTEYLYDDAGRLHLVLENAVETAQYDYDGNGNRTYADDEAWASAGCTANGADELLSCGATAYGHDPSGDRISKTEGGLTTLYGYAATGALRSLTPPAGPAISYVLDPLGRRVGKRVGGALTRGWLYQDSLRPIAELGPGGSTVSQRFVYASRDNVPDYASTASGANLRFIADHLGSIRLVVDAATGAVVEQTDYDAFGRLASAAPATHPFGFAGGLYDAASGWVRFGAREYDAATGRWTTKDPAGFAGGDTNLYGYVHGDPVNFIDVTGEIPIPLIIAGAAFVLGAGMMVKSSDDAAGHFGLAASHVGAMAVGAVLKAVASRVACAGAARGGGGVVAASGGSIRQAVSGINAARLGQSEAVQVIKQVTEASGRRVGGVVDLAGGAKGVIGVVQGANQPVVHIAANGTATFGRGTVGFGVDGSGKVVTTITELVLP